MFLTFRSRSRINGADEHDPRSNPPWSTSLHVCNGADVLAAHALLSVDISDLHTTFQVPDKCGTYDDPRGPTASPLPEIHGSRLDICQFWCGQEMSFTTSETQRWALHLKRTCGYHLFAIEPMGFIWVFTATEKKQWVKLVAFPDQLVVKAKLLHWPV